MIPTIPAPLDLLGTAVFALTGALLAARLRQTFVTMAFFALITGVGGGSVRDLLIGAPVFWVRDPWVAPVCLTVALIAWFTPRKWWEGSLLEWADAAGLAAYAVLGTAKALAFDVAPVPAVLMGVITGCVGGIIRDVLAGRPSILMRPELYVTAAALSAGLCALGDVLGLPREIAWSVAALAGFALRGAAIRFGIHLPAYQRAGD
ncbi:trimeric intracellular cation channel family protein [Novosphingobium sp.]|uniref:trimeric intracellular cation channel family protein n=1 Tax=Novosphingobium sp. TaxID=1874826 RepID=UPI0027326799|nr:trimeric intracellular cation channel family protein [Novosphingobium sp.]MDP3907430.1 trimeric intracellular cation channel family protein [Novosphingobium sp.]